MDRRDLSHVIGRGARPSAPWPLLSTLVLWRRGKEAARVQVWVFDYCLQGTAGPPTGCSFHHVDFSLGERSHQSSHQLQNAINQS
jgi:hypothetical protein